MAQKQIKEQVSGVPTEEIDTEEIDQLLNQPGGGDYPPIPQAQLCHRATAAVEHLALTVWVNSKSQIFHRLGRRWFQKTRQDELMSCKEALGRGYKAAANGQ